MPPSCVLLDGFAVRARVALNLCNGAAPVRYGHGTDLGCHCGKWICCGLRYVVGESDTFIGGSGRRHPGVVQRIGSAHWQRRSTCKC